MASLRCLHDVHPRLFVGALVHELRGHSISSTTNKAIVAAADSVVTQSSTAAGSRFRKVLPVSQVPTSFAVPAEPPRGVLFTIRDDIPAGTHAMMASHRRRIPTRDCVEGLPSREPAVAFFARPRYKPQPRQQFPEQRYCTAPSTPSAVAVE